MTEKDHYQTRATLIQRVQNQHDEESWDEFVRVYRRYIYAIIRSMNISEHDTEDILQQVLINVWNHLPKMDYDKINRFRSWLSTVTKNCVTDFIRKRSRDANRLEKAGQDDTLTYLKSIRLPEIDAIAEREWEVHLTNLAMENIEPLFSGKAVDAFRLTLEGKSVEEIAKALDLKENSVYRLKNRVKERLIQEIRHLRDQLE
ncbi:MAG: sigma-70 family RNA polymerase sigma factor [Pontiella sp.]|nr:sigma-70 family RNA polymerase sigma factor [Pontiella sp.]MBT8045603.1 sigma-70 family RNA polymerase sigma factor [Pontiella sp.]NNJ70015.1 sigma-70 family RNA polymerase sigma factor [Kiritimatiellales bacterium]